MKIVITLLLVCVSLKVPLIAQSDGSTESSVVVTGRVVSTNGQSFTDMPKPVRDLSVAFVVDNVIAKPPGLSLKKGDRVAIVPKQKGDLPAGKTLKVLANTWIVGSTVALSEVSHASAAQIVGGGTAMLYDANNQEVKGLVNRYDSASAVVVGQVTEIHDAPLTNAGGASNRITEHDPKWKDAVVQIHSWIKGDSSKSEVVVRFPSSRDVAFRNFPKFQVGQSGTFLLSSPQSSLSNDGFSHGAPVRAFEVKSERDVLRQRDADLMRFLSTMQTNQK
jgi:hypothetical protein